VAIIISFCTKKAKVIVDGFFSEKQYLLDNSISQIQRYFCYLRANNCQNAFTVAEVTTAKQDASFLYGHSVVCFASRQAHFCR